MAEVVAALNLLNVVGVLSDDDRIVAGTFRIMHPMALTFFVGLTGVGAIGFAWLAFFLLFQDGLRRELRIMTCLAFVGGSMFLGSLAWTTFWLPGATLQDVSVAWVAASGLALMVVATWGVILRIWYLMDVADQQRRMGPPPTDRQIDYEDISA